MTRINQLISVVGGVKSDVTGQLANIKAALAQPGLFSGHTRTHRWRNDQTDNAPLPGEAKRVQLTAERALDETEKLFTRLLDVTRTLDEANAGARADLVVDGQALLPAVTVGHLLFLERELGNLHELVAKMPVRDQAAEWTTDGTEAGQAKTTPVETTSTTKAYVNHTRVKAEVIDGHVIQPVVDVVTRDEVSGYWTAVQFSGAMDPGRKRLMLDRITQLQEAAKYAREEANSAEISDVREGAKIFGWLRRP